ncbi:hypothetical protein [Permianibacter aggregans]|uniref:Uncharacterized protein n=1 Tax=Permianibacter aggregans TaxID=1510150 RepID=A0A4R6V154_9GAMM|nr:hypothetical protein [Permianibacter aggregans]QGX39511.1 hypothetical protein E2H98_07525 [Permianibacter aggregans]TDQ49744.1 hypothetical protein EV696_103113 [Permianibacter aggregans]
MKSKVRGLPVAIAPLQATIISLLSFSCQVFAADEPALPVDGHVALLLQADSIDTNSQALNLTLPIADYWAIEGGYSRAEGETSFSPSSSMSFESNQQSLGLLYDPGSWSITLGAMRYEDEEFLQTDQYRLRLGHQGDAFSLSLEAMGRQHTVQLQTPNQTYRESFDSVGLGIDASYLWSNGIRLYGGLQSYDYQQADILDADFRQLLGLALLFPEYADRIMRTYRSLLIQQQRAEGGLVKQNAFVGLEWQWRSELFAVDYYQSTAEIDDANIATYSLLWSHFLSDDWLLDVSAGISSSDVGEDSEFASIGIHLFW